MTDRMMDGINEGSIAIVGMAGRVPGARSLEAFWQLLRDGRESTVRLADEQLAEAGVPEELRRDPNFVPVAAPLEDMECFDHAFFGFNPREGDILDPQHRHFLEVTWEALEHAGHPPERFAGSIGVFAGSGHNAYLPYNLLTNPELVADVGMFLLRHTGNDKDFLTTRASYLFDLTGPSIAVQTACSTSLVAIHMAAQSLLNGECDLALAGGVTVELDSRFGYLYRENEILSPDGTCRSFDASSQGTFFGSGVGVVALRRLEDALADGDTVHAVIIGSAVNNDGSGKVGYLAPSVAGQAKAIAEALAIADVPADTVSYIEAHGTGTALGDPIEVAALTQAFRQFTDSREFCGLGSVKSNIGHLDTAAGVAGVIKVALSMANQALPPTVHFRKPNPDCRLDGSPFQVVDRLTPWETGASPRRAGVSSLGVGGTNAHVILQEAPVLPESPTDHQWQLLTLSAKSEAALDRTTDNLVDWLEDHQEVPLGDVAWTLQEGRSAMPWRRIAVADSHGEAVTTLQQKDARKVYTASIERPAGEVTFMFAGGGAQYRGMGHGLYQAEPVYREAVDECLALLDEATAASLAPLLFARESDDDSLERPAVALPALFITQVAQAKLWRSWGIEPASCIGHSMGEYTAAYLAGVFTLADALQLVLLRGRLFEKVPQGAMLSVALAPAELEPLLGPELSLAAVNGPELCVASGPSAAIDRLAGQLESQEIDSVRIHIDVAAHSAMLEPILDEFSEFLRQTQMQAPQLPFVSNLSGEWITSEQATSPDYWVSHLRRTVQFAEGVKLLFDDPDRVLLEVGPGRTLATLAGQHPEKPDGLTVLTSMRHPEDDVADHALALTVLGRLWLAGQSVDWPAIHQPGLRRRVPLPTYPFERIRHWIEPGASRSPKAVPPQEPGGLERYDDIERWFYRPAWRRESITETSRPANPVTILLAPPGGGEPSELKAELESRGHQVIVIEPRLPTDKDQLAGVLVSSGGLDRLTGLVWLAGGGESSSLDDDLERAFHGPVALAQALGAEGLEQSLRLILVTHGSQQVAGEDLIPELATIAGPGRVIPREYPNIDCRIVDLPVVSEGLAASRMAPSRRVADELEAADRHSVVAYRGTDRWVQRVEPWTLPASEQAKIRPGGVYLVTGGLGGLGLSLARHLAEAQQARLVLAGRTPLPPREEWDDFIENHDPGHPLAKSIREVRLLESSGAEVLAVTLDVTDHAATSALIDRIRQEFGGIDGVFHAAGVLEDGIIQLKERATAARVLAPKVQGTAAIAAALADEPDAFVLLFSSVSSITGLTGQVDYTAANAYLDAVAARQAVEGRRWTAVNWSAWRDVGMAARMASHLGLSAAEYEAGATPVDHPLLDRCLVEAGNERVYATELSTASHWLLGEHRVRGGNALIPGTGYLELVRAAFEHHRQDRAVELHDVTFRAPFSVADDEAREIRVSLTTNGHGSADFKVLSKLGNDGDRWCEHSSGSVRYVDRGSPQTIDLAQVANRCSRKIIDGASIGEPVHLDFGPRWSNRRTIQLGDDEALLQLELPAEFSADLPAMALHPALMDMATAGAQELIPGFEETTDFYVPLSYGRVKVLAPLPAVIWSNVRFREAAGGNQFATFDVTLTDSDGRVLVEITDFVMIKVKDKSLLTPEAMAAAEVSLSRQVKPQATANRILEISLEGGISSREGAAVIDRLVTSAAPPQLIVSPLDFDTFLGELDKPVEPEARQGSKPREAPEQRRDLSPAEQALADHDAVLEAAAMEFEERPGEWRLVAYVVYDPVEPVTVSELRRHVRRTAGEGMVPHVFIELDELPRNADGSLARDSLESPYGQADDIVAPRTETERALAELWQELLGIEAVSVYDNFFDIGGHSLLSMRLISRMDKRMGVRLQHEHIVVSTLEQLAAKCEQALSAELAGADR